MKLGIMHLFRNDAHPVGCDSPLQKIIEVWLTLAHLYPQGACSEQDSIQLIFLFISPLLPHASSGAVRPLVSPDEEAAGAYKSMHCPMPSAFLTYDSTN